MRIAKPWVQCLYVWLCILWVWFSHAHICLVRSRAHILYTKPPPGHPPRNKRGHAWFLTVVNGVFEKFSFFRIIWVLIYIQWLIRHVLYMHSNSLWLMVYGHSCVRTLPYFGDLSLKCIQKNFKGWKGCVCVCFIRFCPFSALWAYNFLKMFASSWTYIARRFNPSVEFWWQLHKKLITVLNNLCEKKVSELSLWF